LQKFAGGGGDHMIRAAMNGRVGGDPVARTDTGKNMTTASLAVNAGRAGGRNEEWFSLVSFGVITTELLRHQKGNLASLSGQLFRRSFRSRDGQGRTDWSSTIDLVVSARTVRKAAPQSLTS
jgi:single-strand DNA-binding protein